MPTRLRLLHTWQRQLAGILPGERRTRVAGLALLTLGILLAGTVVVPRVAAVLPGSACDASRGRRLRRWLANTAVVVDQLWPPLRRALLADLAGQPLLLVFDPTPQAGHATVLVLGVVRHKRVLPLAWTLVPQQEPWGTTLATELRALATAVAADLPADCAVTLVADRGVTGPETIAACLAVGWHVTFRLNAGPAQTNRVRVAGIDRPLWAFLEEQAFAFAGPVELFKAAGWLPVHLTCRWDRRFAEPWILLSDQPAGPARCREYARRSRIEATFADTKRRGFDLERTKLRDRARLDRLLLALTLALWWGLQLGARVIRSGRRRRYDRADRRDCSLLRLGVRDFQERLWHDRLPPLPLSRHHGRWRYVHYV